MSTVQWKRFLCVICTVILLMGQVLSASSEEAAAAADAREWQTDIRLSIVHEDRLMQDAGMDLKQWDEVIARRVQDGLANPLTREALLAADADTLILEEDGKVYQIGASSLFGPVTDAPEAYELAYRLVELLGGSAQTVLSLNSRLTMNGKTVYSFLQICDGREVLGSTLKIALNGNQEVTAVFSCLDAEGSREWKRITREEAEAEAAARSAGSVQPELTERRILFLDSLTEAMNMDLEDDPYPHDLVWIVYSTNEENPEEYPYVANYIRADGTWLHSLPVREPGDEEARCGFRIQDIFAGMTADTCTGEITDVSGKTRTVTVPVMRSEADGCWYLGDAERRIAFADYDQFAYGENHDLVLLKSEDNTWDSGDIYTFYNYLRAWQFYTDMGWIGPDGEGTGVLIFKGMCYSNGATCDNACSCGFLEGWQVFAYSSQDGNGEPSKLTWALDIMAHEYTHTFTGTVMNNNLYQNDPGAINEAMSDIMGNLIEYICKDTEDPDWCIGENADFALRVMIDPEAGGQPTSVWGKYYGPQVTTFNAVNDHGGVHYNSSMLNLIASSFCLEEGMSYEDAVRLWVLVALGLTPKTDYVQMGALLSWAMEESGMSDQYGEALNRLITRTRLGSTGLPESLPEGQKMIRLKLPDTEAFRGNKDWILLINQIDVKTRDELRTELLKTAGELITSPEKRKEFTESVKQLLSSLKLKTSEMSSPILILEGLDKDQIREGLLQRLMDLLTQSEAKMKKGEQILYSWEEMDTGVIPAVIEDKTTVYTLMNVTMGGSKIEKMVYLLGSSWYDLTDYMMEDAYNPDLSITEKLSSLVSELKEQGLRNLFGIISERLGEKETEDASGIPMEDLPTAGLEYIRFDNEGK